MIAEAGVAAAVAVVVTRGERTMPESKFARPAAPEPVLSQMILVRRRDTSPFFSLENLFQYRR